MTHIVNKIIIKIKNIYKQIYSRIYLTKYPLLNSHLRKKRIAQGDVGIIFMLHRIADKDNTKLPPNENLKVSPKQLQKTIDKYRHAGFDFLSLDEIYQHITNQTSFSKPFVAFTIDDGYADNFNHAYPIFKKNNVPFCIYIATDFINKKAILWWFSIEELIINNDYVFFNSSKLICQTKQQKWDAFRIIREFIIKCDQKDLESVLNKSFAEYQIDWHRPILDYGMNWEQICELCNDPLCTIGSHTKSHASIENLNREQILEEIENANNEIEQNIGKKVRHFSLPYGKSPHIDVESIYEKLGLQTIAYATGGPINAHIAKKTRSFVYLQRFSLELS